MINKRFILKKKKKIDSNLQIYSYFKCLLIEKYTKSFYMYP